MDGVGVARRSRWDAGRAARHRSRRQCFLAQSPDRADCIYWAIGIGLAPEFRGRGYGSAAQRLIVRYLFAHTQVNRIEATTEITNLAEQRALEKAGFTREGILRGTTFRQGQWHDQVIYSVLRDEVKLEDSAAADGQV
jgi:RimJ/RimL family protein N-acetyltransferase